MEYNFEYRGKRYRMTDKWENTEVWDSAEFQLEQFKYLTKTRDWVTLENRLTNQLMLGYIEETTKSEGAGGPSRKREFF